MAANIKRSARDFFKEYKIQNLNAKKISEIIRSQGYKIIRFGKVYNEENVEIIINSLKLNGYVKSYSAFTYTDDRYRLVFLEDNISETEELILLSHEEGHIYNRHFNEKVIAGKNILDEHEANEFAHYILKPTIRTKVMAFIITHRFLSILIGIMLALMISGSCAAQFYLKQQTYYGNYYATMSGTKYHKETCIYVRDKSTKHRVTKEDIETKKLEPCKVCLPELWGNNEKNQ